MFKLRVILLQLCILAILGCSKVNHLTNTETKNYQVSNEKIKPDPTVDDLIKPYRKDLNKVMDEVIGTTSVDLMKDQPEGTLNNWMADAVHEQTVLTGQEVDCTILNYGGIRIPSIGKGEITVGKIFELMPFDNEVTLMSLDKETMLLLFHKIAEYGGWPVSKEVQMTIENGMAKDISINGKPLEDRIYQVAIPDYIANGGDSCFFLTDKKRKKLSVLVRDALLDNLKELTKNGKAIETKLDDRILNFEG